MCVCVCVCVCACVYGVVCFCLVDWVGLAQVRDVFMPELNAGGRGVGITPDLVRLGLVFPALAIAPFPHHV